MIFPAGPRAQKLKIAFISPRPVGPGESKPNWPFVAINFPAGLNNSVAFSRASKLEFTFVPPLCRKDTKLSFRRHEFSRRAQ